MEHRFPKVKLSSALKTAVSIQTVENKQARCPPKTVYRKAWCSPPTELWRSNKKNLSQHVRTPLEPQTKQPPTPVWDLTFQGTIPHVTTHTTTTQEGGLYRRGNVLASDPSSPHPTRNVLAKEGVALAARPVWWWYVRKRERTFAIGWFDGLDAIVLCEKL